MLQASNLFLPHRRFAKLNCTDVGVVAAAVQEPRLDAKMGFDEHVFFFGFGQPGNTRTKDIAVVWALLQLLFRNQNL